MIRNKLSIAVLAVAALALGAAGSHFAPTASAQTAAPATSGGAKILVVSLERVFAESDENKAFGQKMQARIAELQSAASMRAAKLEELQKKLRALMGDANFQNSEFDKLSKEFEQASIDAKIADELAKSEVDRLQKLNLRSISQKIDKEIEAIARDMGATLVISDVRPNVTEAMWAVGKNEQLQNLVGNRLVLYVSPDANVTEQVYTRLNTAYAKAGALPSN